jgi:large subunit ribosomal protein L9
MFGFFGSLFVFFSGSRLGDNLNGRRILKVILRQDFESLGLEGDIVDVANGYARNYLIPKGIAVKSDNASLKALDMSKEKIMARHMKEKESAERVREKVSQIIVNLRRKAGEEDKLYGSVTSREIAQELEKEGIVVDRRKINLDETIRTLGEFEVSVKLHPEVIAKVKVVVDREEEKA